MIDIFTTALFALVAAVLSTAANDIPATYTVDCLSPSITYNPNPDGKFSKDQATPAPWFPNVVENAWNTDFGHDWTLRMLVRADWRHWTSAKFVEGMSAPSASITFVGQAAAFVGPSRNGSVELVLDGETVNSCSANGRNTELVRCNCTTDFGRHTLVVVVKYGDVALSHFEVSTGNDECVAG